MIREGGPILGDDDLRELEADDGPEPAPPRLYDVDELDRVRRIENYLKRALDLMTSAQDKRASVARAAAYYAARRERFAERRANWSARELERRIRSSR
jgi:hypothetical protein